MAPKKKQICMIYIQSWYLYLFFRDKFLLFHPLTSFCFNYLGSAVMDFFIMWLCFYTYCILALYAGARHDRRSENSLSHRQIQQLRIEYLQTIRKQQFGIRTYWIYEPNTSALTTVRFGAPSIFSVSPHAVRAPLPAVDPNFSLS